MSNLRALATLLSAAIGLTSAFAQFDGPAPLSWRWVQPTTVSPTGSPAVDGDVIYVASGQRLYALNREDGNQKWRFPVANFLDTNFKGTPALGGGLVVAATDNRSIYALDAKTGQKVWTYIAPTSVIGSPQISGNLVLFQMTDGVMAITLDKGEPFYKTPIYLKDGIQGSFAIWKDDVLVFSTTSTLYAINIASQHVDWQQQTAGVSLDVQAVTTADTVYFVSNNYLIGINPGDGHPRFSTEVEDDLVLGPAVSKNYILAVTRDGKAYYFRSDGKRLTSEGGKVVPPVDLKSAPLLRPTAVDANRFAVVTTSGTIELLDPTKADASDPKATADNPNVQNKSVIWNYPIRPIGGIQDAPQSNGLGNKGGGPGFGGGPSSGGGLSGSGGGGGLGGGGLGGGGLGGGGGQFGRGGPNASVTKIVTVQAAGSPVLDKSTLLVLARDGSLLAFDKETGIDLTPPKVTMTYPNAGDMVSSKPPLALVFKLEDEASGINEGTVKVTVDGKALDFTLTKEGLVVVRCSETGKNHLTDGKKRILIEVSDWMGNVTHQEFSLTIDNDLPPVQAVPNPNQPGGPGGGKGGGFGGGGGGNGAGASG